MDLWPIPSPYQFKDLSQYSQLTAPASQLTPAALGSDLDRVAIMRPVLLPANPLRLPFWLLLALTFATAAAFPPRADAQAAAPAPSAASTPLLHADDAIRYRVEVVAPSAIATTVEGAVDLIRWQDYADMTEDLFDRLARDAVPQAKDAAATQGYFSANVEITVDRTTQPVTVKLEVTPLAPTRIATVNIDVAGPATDCTGRPGRDRQAARRVAAAKGGCLPAADVDRGEGPRGRHPRGEPLRGGQAHRERSAHRSGSAQRRPRRGARERPAVSHRRGHRHGPQEIFGGAGRQLHDGARGRPLQRAHARRLRAPPARLRLFRKRAGVDRHRSGAGRCSEGDAVDHRGANQTP